MVLPLGLFLQFVRVPAALLIGIWALLQLVFTFIGPAFGAVAWSAHLAGFAFGGVFALIAQGGHRAANAAQARATERVATACEQA